MDEFYASLDYDKDRISRFEDYLEALPQEKHNFIVSAFRSYFNIDSSTVALRVYRSLAWHCSNSFFGESLADLYGAVWGSMTLILFVLFMQEEAQDSFLRIFGFAFAVYMVLALVPALVICVRRDLGLGYMVSLHGYCFSGYCLSVLISGLFGGVYKICAIILGASWTVAMLVRNVKIEVGLNLVKMIEVGGIIVAGHTFLVCCVIYVLY
jgi:hypothetical protein